MRNSCYQQLYYIYTTLLYACKYVYKSFREVCRRTFMYNCYLSCTQFLITGSKYNSYLNSECLCVCVYVRRSNSKVCDTLQPWPWPLSGNNNTLIVFWTDKSYYCFVRVFFVPIHRYNIYLYTYI